MPQIPIIVSREGVDFGGPGVRANARDMGAGIGQAVQQLSQVTSAIGDTMAARQNYQDHRRAREMDAAVAEFEANQRGEKVASAVAGTDLTTIALEARRNGPPDGSGVAESTYEAQKLHIDEKADELFPDDGNARLDYKRRMYNEIGGWREKQVAYQFDQSATYSREQAANGIDLQINTVRTDPTQYNTSVQKIDEVINSRLGLTDLQKQAMRTESHSKVAQARFDASLMNAQTADDFEVLQAELKDETWKKEFTASAYDQTQNALKASYNAFVTGQDAAARATLESAETRTRSREAIPEAELKEIATLARNARSPAINARAIRLADQQRLLRVYGNAPPAQIDATIGQMRGSETLKTDVAGWASAASRATGGEITASYLVNKLQREYPTSALEAGDYGVKAGTSSAKGLFQFTDSTWREMFRKYGPSLGIDVAKYTDAQVLARRDDPAMSTMMAALYAKENKQYLRAQLTTEPNDVDLYMAHFLGPQGAVDFIKAMRAGPNDSVAPTGAFKQAAIDANKGVLQGKSYKEVYDNFAASFMPGVTGAQFDQIDYLAKMREDKVKAINDDPITAFVKDGRMASYELDSEQAFMMRGRDALSAASYYTLPVESMKPFTGAEANSIAKALQDGDADSTLAIMSQIQAMDRVAPGMAKAAFAQLGEKDTVLGYAAELAYDAGQPATAAKIVRGQKALKVDGSAKQLFGTDGSAANAAFYAEVENALSGVAPEQRAAIFDAAKAHYADSHAGKGLTEFDDETFAASVRAVMGSDTSIGEVNGHKTLLPPGLNADDFSDAVDNMDDGNLVAMSLDKLQPIDMEGNPITAADIAGEGQFVAIGGGYYKIMMADGGYLSTGKADPAAPYNMKAFIFTPDVGRMKWLAGRTTAGADTTQIDMGMGVP